MSELEGKRVFVTGSGAGIGKAIAALFTERGARVVVSDINPETAKQSAEEIGAAGVANCDVTDEGQVQAAVQQSVDILGGLDVLVNNAGIEISSPLLQQSTESFDKIFAVNVRGPFVAMKAAIPHLIASKGNIVNIASIAGVGGSPLLGSYCATKAALIQLTRVAAVERGLPRLCRHRHGRPARTRLRGGDPDPVRRSRRDEAGQARHPEGHRRGRRLPRV
jgi:NAD(P)-dependent dehydrogenase (short-subunit alcohol dehydrogenase family)